MMTRDIRFYSTYSMSEFQTMIPSGVTYSATKPLSVNQWTYDDTLKAFQINTDSTKPGMITYELGYLYVGDIIEIEAEVMNISGVQARLAIDQADDANFTVNKVTNFVYCKSDGSFENQKFKLVVKKEGYHKALIGHWTSHVGEIAFRYPRVKVQSIVKNTLVRADNTRRATLRKLADGTFEIRTDYAYDEATVSIESGNILKLVWKKPLFGLKPAVFTNQEYYLNANAYIARSSSNTLATTRVAFYAMGGTDKVNIADLPNDFHISVLVVN